MSESEPFSSPPLTRPLLIVLVCIVMVTLAARIMPEPRTIDDAFITFRYSRNLAAGEGFVYNPGARTLGHDDSAVYAAHGRDQSGDRQRKLPLVGADR